MQLSEASTIGYRFSTVSVHWPRISIVLAKLIEEIFATEFTVKCPVVEAAEEDEDEIVDELVKRPAGVLTDPHPEAEARRLPATPPPKAKTLHHVRRASLREIHFKRRLQAAIITWVAVKITDYLLL